MFFMMCVEGKRNLSGADRISGKLGKSKSKQTENATSDLTTIYNIAKCKEETYHGRKKYSLLSGIYHTRASVENAVDTLKAEKFRNTDISVLFPQNEGSKDFAHEKKHQSA